MEESPNENNNDHFSYIRMEDTASQIRFAMGSKKFPKDKPF